LEPVQTCVAAIIITAADITSEGKEEEQFIVVMPTYALCRNSHKSTKQCEHKDHRQKMDCMGICTQTMRSDVVQGLATWLRMLQQRVLLALSLQHKEMPRPAQR
jgi:hypothetical protein